MSLTARWLMVASCAVTLLGAPRASGADEPLTAGACTLRGRSLDRCLDEVLSPGGVRVGDARSIVFVIDPSPSLKSVRFARALRSAVRRAQSRLSHTRIAALLARPKSRPVTSGPGDAADALDAVDAWLASPRKELVDVYDAVRRGVKTLAARKGAREMVLVTLENGDVESDVEAVVHAVGKARVKLSVLTGQAFLSDTYWTFREGDVPRGMTPRGGEAAFVELPWGWLFQSAVANEHTAGGFAAFGLSRLAASTGGRVFLFDDGRSKEHQCAVTGTSCAFCDTGHLPEGTAYQAALLAGMAPVVDRPKVVLATAARDPLFLGALAAWEEAADAGLVRGNPSVKRAGSGLKLSRSVSTNVADLGRTTGFDRDARKADDLARVCGKIAERLRAAIDAAPATGTSPRFRANAETTYALLRLTRVNLLGFAAFCREVAPVQLHRAAEDVTFPEYSRVGKGYRVTGIRHSAYSLCHGVRPFLGQRLPGGEAYRSELEELADVFDRLVTRYAHTPYGTAMRRSTLARFHLAGVGKYVPSPKRKRPNGEKDDPTTGSGRTPRGGADGGDGSDGPKTGDE